MILLTDEIQAINKVARKISKLTDINSHTESVLVLSKFLKEDESTAKLEILQAKHEAAGYMEQEWMRERESIRQYLMVQVIIQYGVEVRNKLNKCF